MKMEISLPRVTTKGGLFCAVDSPHTYACDTDRTEFSKAHFNSSVCNDPFEQTELMYFRKLFKKH